MVLIREMSMGLPFPSQTWSLGVFAGVSTPTASTGGCKCQKSHIHYRLHSLKIEEEWVAAATIGFLVSFWATHVDDKGWGNLELIGRIIIDDMMHSPITNPSKRMAVVLFAHAGHQLLTQRCVHIWFGMNWDRKQPIAMNMPVIVYIYLITYIDTKGIYPFDDWYASTAADKKSV